MATEVQQCTPRHGNCLRWVMIEQGTIPVSTHWQLLIDINVLASTMLPQPGVCSMRSHQPHRAPGLNTGSYVFMRTAEA